MKVPRSKKRTTRKALPNEGANLPSTDNGSTLPEHLLTKEQLAEFFQVTPRTVEMWMARGLPHYKLGSRRTRFSLPAVQKYIDERCLVVRAA